MSWKDKKCGSCDYYIAFEEKAGHIPTVGEPKKAICRFNPPTTLYGVGERGGRIFPVPIAMSLYPIIPPDFPACSKFYEVQDT